MGFVDLAVSDGVGRLVINRPEVMNAVSPEVLRDLAEGLDALERAQVRVCILSGAGGRAFSAGADLEEMLAQSSESSRAQLEEGIRLTRRLETGSFVTIAAVEGYALGGGTELALACDIRLAAANARFGLPEVKVGIFPGWGGIVRLPRIAPRSLAFDMLLSGRIIDATQAYAAGIVSEVADDVQQSAEATARRLLEAGPAAQRLAREVVAETSGLPLDQALAHATERWMELHGTSEREEGHRAFIEKRPPGWIGAAAL